jgi:FAD/FMN-containing dehydrogenase
MEQAELSRLLRQAELTPLLPHSRDFQRARRVWNADIDRRPAAIVRCRTASEVARAVSCCFASGVDCTVRGGGHNVAGSAVSDGAVLIDLAGMAEVELLEGGEVAVGGGATWAAVDAVTGAAGCAVPAGLISHTGVGGLTLGGGVGWLSRRFGLTCDRSAPWPLAAWCRWPAVRTGVDGSQLPVAWAAQVAGCRSYRGTYSLLRAEVVTAGGQILAASETEHADLLWALRGGGGNFGVVTRFVFRTRPVSRVRVWQSLSPCPARGAHGLAVDLTGNAGSL